MEINLIPFVIVFSTKTVRFFLAYTMGNNYHYVLAYWLLFKVSDSCRKEIISMLTCISEFGLNYCPERNVLAISTSSAVATWLSILSILILCVAPARFLNRDKKSGGRVNKYKKNIL